jgi:hypothetical protein
MAQSTTMPIIEGAGPDQPTAGRNIVLIVGLLVLTLLVAVMAMNLQNMGSVDEN